MKYNSRSIYGCTMAEPEFTAPDDCKLTQSEDGKRLYIHIYAYPFRHLKVKGLVGKIRYAQFLHDASEIKYTENQMDHMAGDSQPDDNDNMVIFDLPVVKPNSLVPVIEIFLK